MKLLLLGCNGQVGWELQRSLAPLGELIILDRHTAGGDLSHLETLRAKIKHINPDILINAAAYTAVDKAETEREQCQLINTEAVAVMAAEMAALGGWLIHYSTDYVFDGQGETPWREDDHPCPINFYGQSKWEGEQAIREAKGQHLIFRTSWVYARRGHNFAKTILRLAAQRNELNIINDQFGAPTGADLIADVTAQALIQTLRQPQNAGTYHLVAHGVTTWYEYASFIIEQSRLLGIPLSVETITAVPSTAYVTPAKRPANSRLNTDKLSAVFGLSMPPWQQGIQRMMTEIQENL